MSMSLNFKRVKIHLSNDVCKSYLSSYFMQCSTQLLKYIEGFFFAMGKFS